MEIWVAMLIVIKVCLENHNNKFNLNLITKLYHNDRSHILKFTWQATFIFKEYCWQKTSKETKY